MIEIRYHIDQPGSWSRLSRCLLVRGWCFGSDGQRIKGLRLRSPGLCFSGVVGIPRPDVKAARPDAPDNNTGFELRAMLPAGRISLCLEAQLEDGSWQTLLSQTVVVPRQWRPLWLGGGDWTELLSSQMPGYMQYPGRPLKVEKYPRVAAGSLPRPKLAIATPSFQQARFLEETLRSVLGQTGITCEYALQDGGSTDNSPEIIRLYAEKAPENPPTRQGSTPRSAEPGPASPVRLTAWESSRDGGQADAIIRAFAKTSGEPNDLMAWINSDDFYLPGALSFVADYFASHPEVDVLYGHRVLVDEDSREIGRWFLPQHDNQVLRLYDFVPQETMFWRRRVWDKAGGLDPSLKFAMDWDLLLRFQAAGAKIVRVPYFLACFRIHAQQKTAAAMHDVGQQEITRLRERTHGHTFSPQELENDPCLIRYLRKSAFIEFAWNLGIRLT